MKTLKNIFKTNYSKMDARQLNPLVLAFVGDSFFSFYVKTERLNLNKSKVNSLNSDSAKLVNAHSQREMLFKIIEQLTEEELDIVHRGRNSNIHSKAKNFSIEEYRHATAFEALIGYLYLIEEYERLEYLLGKCWE
ncbi:MAG: Mini-ribonuclease 3 [Clostridia bacterium]|nr:Mini-ribonuclease 3 [Clostridia bacterium]